MLLYRRSTRYYEQCNQILSPDFFSGDILFLFLPTIDVQYIVAIDAGSAGSRAIAYKFHINHSNKKITIDDEEKCAKIDGGLGSYVKNPAEVCGLIKKFMDNYGLITKFIYVREKATSLNISFSMK